MVEIGATIGPTCIHPSFYITVTPQRGNYVLSPPFCKGYIYISISIMLDVAVAEEAPSMPAAKKPSAKEMRKEETLARMEQAMYGGQRG